MQLNESSQSKTMNNFIHVFSVFDPALRLISMCMMGNHLCEWSLFKKRLYIDEHIQG